MLRRLRYLTQKIKHAFKKRSLQFTISITFTLVAVTGMILVAVILSARFVNSNEQMISDDNRRMLNQVNLNLDNYLHNMMRVSDSMYYRVIKNVDIDTDMESLTKDMGLLYETNRDLLVSVAVFTDNGEVVAAEPLSQLKATVDPKSQSWFVDANERIENLHFSTPHVQNLFINSDNRYNWVVSLSRSIELTRSGSIVHGVLLVDMNFSGIEQICKNVDLGESGYLYLIDSNGEIIYHPRQQLIYSDLLHENNRQAAEYEDGTHTETFEGQQRLVTVKTVGYTGWRIVGVVPMPDITNDYSQFQMFSMFFVCFAIFLLISVNMFLSQRIANPIKSLESSVKELEKGNLGAHISVKGSYEIQHLGKAIRSMAEQMRKLMDDVVAEQESKRKSEMDALQSQINPHFLYNTLDMIAWKAMASGNQETVDIVVKLARFYRLSLSNGSDFLPLSDEVEHVRLFVELTNLCRSRNVQLITEVAPNIADYPIMKLILQPIVENSLFHGLYELSDREGVIRLTAEQIGSYVQIQIADNGVGIEKSKLAELLAKKERPVVNTKRGGYGIGNILERLRIYYDDRFTFQIESAILTGTTVTIRIPYSRNDSPQIHAERTMNPPE